MAGWPLATHCKIATRPSSPAWKPLPRWPRALAGPSGAALPRAQPCRRSRAGRSSALCSAASAAEAPGLRQRAAAGCAAALVAAALALQPLPASAQGFIAGAPPGSSESLFDSMAYAGRWYEVASLKEGFAGEGQQDCHCTQGIYVPQEDPAGGVKLQVNTFCVHGGPQGRLSGIQGSVSCAEPLLLELLPEFKSELERADGIVEKCVLRFDSLPFLPAEPYNVIRTDYTTYALVQGAKDRSFVQIYSRVPNPGEEFIREKKQVLAALGYPVDRIRDTPQDCEPMSTGQMMAAMDAGMAGRDLMPAGTPPQLAMRGYDLGPVKGIAFERARNPLEAIKDVLSLLGMSAQ